MATFFKSKKAANKPVVAVIEKPRFFKQVKEATNQERLPIISSEMFRDRFFMLFFCLWLLPLLAAGIYSFANLKLLPNQIPLFYSQVWGESQLAKKQFIFLPVSGTLFLGALNFVLANFFYSKNRVFAYLLMGTSSLIAILAVITIFNIINLVH